MTPNQVTFPLGRVYRKKKIAFHQAKAVAVRPEGDAEDPAPGVDIVYTSPERRGETGRIHYDYLVNATGPKLRFDLTPGLGPDSNSHSVCTSRHAAKAAEALNEVVEQLQQGGQRKTLVIGMGHGTCTCEGAAFEYVFNVDHVLRENGVRGLADVIYLTNEHELGDFGVGGMVFGEGERQMTSEEWMTGLFRERDIGVIDKAHVTEVLPNAIRYEQIDGTTGEVAFDFSMLLPPFSGVGLSALDRDGRDISETMFAPNGFLKVDADYTPKPYEEWSAADWPRTYESPTYPNVFGIGIAFAPPHAISRPYKTPGGTPVAPAPPRTGMPAGIQGRAVAMTIASRVRRGDPTVPARTASMANMGAACIASIGAGLRHGAAATITMSPIIPDYEHYPGVGRDVKESFGEVGLAGHWLKRMLHTLFIYKAKARLGWWLIPE
jgi:sulfide:quinone oxidoreductase